VEVKRKVLLLAWPWRKQLTHLDWGKDATEKTLDQLVWIQMNCKFSVPHFSVNLNQLSNKHKRKVKPHLSWSAKIIVDDNIHCATWQMLPSFDIMSVNWRITSPSCSYRLWFRWRVRWTTNSNGLSSLSRSCPTAGNHTTPCHWSHKLFKMFGISKTVTRQSNGALHTLPRYPFNWRTAGWKTTSE